MKIVIDIPKDDFIKAKEDSENHLIDRVWDAVAHGKPLPEHHGRLIDANELKRELIDNEWITNFDGGGLEDLVNNAPTIIEADKGVLEKINEKQDSLRTTCKAWDEAINRDDYIN